MPRFPFPAAIDSTMRKTFVSCPQKFIYEFCEGLGSPHPSIHLHAGACFARGMEILRTEFYLNKRSLPDSVSLACQAMLVAWGDFEPMFSWSEGYDCKSLDDLFAALDFYVATWDPSTDPVQPLILNGKISVEFSFAIPIPGVFHPETDDPLLYAGRFDMLGLYNDTLFVVDEKTSKQLGPTWADQWEMRSQFTGYVWAAKCYGHEVGGAIVRGVSFLKHGFGSAQALTYREDWKVDRWLRQLTKDALRMIEAWKSGDPDLALDEACVSYGRACSYQPLCNSPDPEQWKREYVVHRWNPLTRVL